MSDPMMQEYRERWQAVAAIEIQEQRSATVDLRLQQLDALLRLAIGLGLPLDDADDEEEAVRQRWAKLKGAQR